ncbi:hypothetical protein F5887DRAFT_926889 [Amanita rubescens]|nr:hypothetical protein F5887DRAFT_926889 [Amanita rubescens]
MNIISDLPTEVLTEIVCQCDNLAISETCKTFAAVTHSIPSLWTTVILCPRQFTIDRPDFLRAQILRTKGAMLTVCIGLVTEPTDEVSALCKLLAEYNAQIREFALAAHTSFLAGGVVCDVFPNREVLQALEVLSILTESESNLMLYPEWPQLDMVLADATTIFPNLRKLHINTFHDCVPMLPLSASFSHLSTLVLDGSREDECEYPYVVLIAPLLNCTPQLESLWMKHHLQQNWHDLTRDFGPVKGRLRSEISFDIRLPRLRHLAVSVPGIACDLIGCITAPMVEDLHLDGSREPLYEKGKWLDDEWEDEDTTTTYEALRLFASRCRSVRRFAVTKAYLSRNAWDWIMFGEDERGPPFPMLECIALHGIYDAEWSGFDVELLEKFAREPSLPLKRLVLLYCDFPLHASTVVEAFRASGAEELECDEYVPQWEADEWEQLEELGVSFDILGGVGSGRRRMVDLRAQYRRDR